MAVSRSFPVYESASAARRIDAACAFLRQCPAHEPVTIVAATRDAADDLARRLAVERGATLGVSRFSLTQIAVRIAGSRLAREGVAPAALAGVEAVATRAAFDASTEGDLTYFGAVAGSPGFPRALAHTLDDLRASGATPDAIGQAGEAGADLARLLARAEQELADAATADRTRLLSVAAAEAGRAAECRVPLVLLDVAVDTPVEEALVRALCDAATTVVATVPAHDRSARTALERAGGVVRTVAEPTGSCLAQLRAHLFGDARPPVRPMDGSVRFFSAPGEGRESVEVARAVLEEARRGVRFDDIAVLVRAPHHYHGLLEHAFARAGIPAWFDRGSRRPHPAGRAFLALLACAAEGLSARRFAEYLSLGQIPSPDGAEPRADGTVAHASAQALARASGPSLPAPRRWEHLIVEASVIGGDPERWTRRLDGLAAQFRGQIDEARRQDPESARVLGLARDLARLADLRAFALPIVTRMAAWPVRATWGEWLRELDTLAPLVLDAPAYVERVLGELRPMAAVGPVTIDEVRSVLNGRLRLVEREAPASRYGRVLVSSPARIRGRTFRVVFVPGLAERMFPQKPRQDPLLLDAAREQLDAHASPPRLALATRAEQGRRERVMLHLAAGAATERLYVSYPRLDAMEGRARVPSFYALDVLRGATGRIPDHDALARAAAEAGDPSLAWPAPADPDRAIDDQEHDLSILRLLLDAREPDAVRGHAQYLLRQNQALRRSVTDRWARAERRWSPSDGLQRVTDRTHDALTAQRLGRRPYSLSALQRYAACPYQFLLGAIYRLQPAEHPHPLQRLDPLTKGSLIHRIQATVFRELERRNALPVTGASVDMALTALDAAVATVAETYREQLAPAIARVWHEEIAAIARDLRDWLRGVAAEGDHWTPRYYEFSFGLPIDEERDARSVRDPVPIDGRFILRGSVDLIDEHRLDGSLRVTDHKTGRNRTSPALVVGGGAVLQPVLYALVVEQVTGRTVRESRLSFCTAAGGYAVHPIAMTPTARRAGLEVLEVVDRAIERGDLAAAPARGACAWCDYRPVCGPNVEDRVARKPQERLRDLTELRSRP